MLKLLFKNHYPVGLKFFIDYLILVVIFYFVNQINDIIIIYNDVISNIVFPFISVFVLYILKVYNVMFRFINVNDIIRLIIGLSLSFIICFLFAGNFDKILVLNYLLLFFFDLFLNLFPSTHQNNIF